jgi:hypothetical protein
MVPRKKKLPYVAVPPAKITSFVVMGLAAERSAQPLQLPFLCFLNRADR